MSEFSFNNYADIYGNAEYKAQITQKAKELMGGKETITKEEALSIFGLKKNERDFRMGRAEENINEFAKLDLDDKTLNVTEFSILCALADTESRDKGFESNLEITPSGEYTSTLLACTSAKNKTDINLWAPEQMAEYEAARAEQESIAAAQRETEAAEALKARAQAAEARAAAEAARDAAKLQKQQESQAKLEELFATVDTTPKALAPVAFEKEQDRAKAGFDEQGNLVFVESVEQDRGGGTYTFRWDDKGYPLYFEYNNPTFEKHDKEEYQFNEDHTGGIITKYDENGNGTQTPFIFLRGKLFDTPDIENPMPHSSPPGGRFKFVLKQFVEQ